mgnify:FL=1
MSPLELKKEVAAGRLDTVIVALPDMFGRLMGKRMAAGPFLEHALHEGTHGCSYLLTVNLEMDPLDGFRVANWESGFGDFALAPDPATLRVLPWHEKTALVLCDFRREDGTDVAEAPRAVLKRQLARLAKLGLSAQMAGELEFYLFNQSYADAWKAEYRGLAPSSDYRIDYHVLQPGRDEALLGDVRRMLPRAGIAVESSKGEWGRGQHEVNLVHAEPLRSADDHVVFKHAVKELAARHGQCASFMAKWCPSEAGSSCHVHLSLWKGKTPALWDGGARDYSKYFRACLGGLMKYAPEFSLWFAPTINSYKRYQAGSWAPTKIAWARDNRTTGFRVVGAGTSARIENRMPGADANPYLTFAAMLAAALAGAEEGLDCGKPYEGNAYVDAKLPALPGSLSEAADLFEHSTLARKVFGDGVVDFYVRHARLECAAYANAVTDWEKTRYFERI